MGNALQLPFQKETPRSELAEIKELLKESNRLLNEIHKEYVFPSSDNLKLIYFKKRLVNQFEYDQESNEYILSEKEKRMLEDTPGLLQLLQDRNYQIDEKLSSLTF